MVFGFSYGEVFLLIAGSVVLLGPKDLPIIARAAGRLTGRAVGYLQTMRGQIDTIMQQSQVNDVQKELREAMAQIDAIRHEVRSGMSIMQPRPLVRENFEDPGSRIQQVTNLVRKVENTLDQFADSKHVKEQNVRLENPDKRSVQLQCQATSYARFAGHLGGVANSVAITGIGPSFKQVDADKRQITVLPISAVSLGLFPARTGPIQGGSDIVLESLAEQKVAQQAVEFLQQPNELYAFIAEKEVKEHDA